MSNYDKDTTHKGGRLPPEVSLEYIANDLLQYFQGFQYIQSAKKDIKKKYNSIDLYNEDLKEIDITKAWGKTQRMDTYASKRKIWSLAILLQIIVLDLSKYSADEEDCSEDISEDSSAKSKSKKELKKKSFVKLKGGVFKTSKKLTVKSKAKHPIYRNTKLSNKPITEFQNKPITELRNKKQIGGSTEETYIRIPLAVMNVDICDSSSRSRCTDEKQTYKLIDGVPSSTKTMKKTSYVMQYDNQTRNAAWVFEILNKEHLEDYAERTGMDFIVDDKIRDHYRACGSNDKCNKAGYDRGHLAAAANHTWSEDAMRDTFLLSNMAPQNPGLNKGKWKALEQHCRDITNDNRNVYVYTGPLYCHDQVDHGCIDQNYYMRVVGDKAVPTHFFKVIILEKNDGQLEVECYMLPNDEQHDRYKKFKDFKTTLEHIEKVSGLEFSEKLTQTQEERNVIVKWKDCEGVKMENKIYFITSKKDCQVLDI